MVFQLRFKKGIFKHNPLDVVTRTTKTTEQMSEEAEKWFKKKLRVPENWDRSDYEIPRYSFNDMVDLAEQFSNQEVEKALNISELALKKYEDEYYKSNSLVKMPRISTFKSGMLKVLEHLKTNKEQTKDGNPELLK